MRRILLCISVILSSISTASAIDDNTVEIVYNGTTATVTIASNISSYITVQSGTSSHVKLVQSDTFAGVDPTVDNEDGEIIYVLSGTSTNGEFYMEGSYKATVELNGLTLTNPSGAAIALMDGKRVSVSAKKGTTNTITDGVNDVYNGSLHCKGHMKLKGKGTLNVVGNSKHAIYSKEYLEVKNLTLNVTAAAKDAIHCKEYLLMESGTVTISAATEDGIQVEQSSDPVTGTTTNHEDENSGNFYMTGGVLTIKGYSGKAIKTDGIITYSGGTQNFDTNDTEITAGINQSAISTVNNAATAVYDLNGRQLSSAARLSKGVYLVKENGTTKKVLKK